jgi:beta-phosphoglucomutase
MERQPRGAVIFDLDGVITNTVHYHFLAWKRLADELNIPFDAAFNERLKGIDRMGSLDLILGRVHRATTAEERRALADRKNTYYQQLIATMTPADLLPGAVEALIDVRQAGFSIALASVSRNAFTVLDRLGITDRFDYIVDAAQVRHGKPDPEIFLTAAEYIGVPPARCIGVEDAAAGVQAIKAAGMYAVGVGDLLALAQADRVIPDLTAFHIGEYLAGLHPSPEQS